MMTRKAKKSETLQVRLPHGMKRDFMRRCEIENRAASDLIRDFIDDYLARPVEILTSEKAVMIRRTFVYPALAAAGLFGAVVILLPTTSQATSLREDFAALDADKDGFINAAEFKPPEDGMIFSKQRISPAAAAVPASGISRMSRRPDPAGTIARLDTDGDRKLSFEEYRAMRVGSAMAIFQRGDKDQDHRLTEAEYVEGATPSAAVVAKMKTGAPDPKRDAAIAQMRNKAAARFGKLDANHDGVLTLEEITPS